MSESAKILKTDTRDLFESAVSQSAELLRAGEVVALPTETVYGLAANALDPSSVAKIFTVKGRPANNPIIVHVASLEMARACVKRWPKAAGLLARAFWPGPLTMVLPRAAVIPDIVTAGGSTVGVRWPSHPFIQAVIRECGFPIAAPSANPFSSISPTTAEHVRKGLGNRIPLIVDGGAAQVGIESTVLDLSVTPPALLRPGMIHDEALASVLGKLRSGTKSSGAVLKSPGQLPKHYAPQAKLLVLAWRDEADLRAQLKELKIPGKEVRVLAHTHSPAFGQVSVLPREVQAFARSLYAELHAADEAGARFIIVEALPKGAEWKAIADRLQRAAT
jgi:L-threonylcarbamoyladenylate synthase